MFVCGEIHYFRVPKPLWRDRLLKLKRAGANCVSTYIPWNWHSPREDIVDFTDSYSQWHVPGYYSRDLAGFLELASQLGLKVIARPGPYICSEWDSGGHPNWLYIKTSKLRSLDPVYMEYSRKWYKEVFKVLKPFIDRNVVEAIQVENEYFWGNEKFIEELYNTMHKFTPYTLLFTNENYYLSKIPNTIDDYPATWDIKAFDEKVKKYLSSQPGLFKMFMELEGGWFKSIRYGYNPTNRLSFPSEWTELLVKTALGMGIDNFNIYMFHGGSNPAYYTGKYVDPSYDYEASIREWGGISDRYYKLKRVFMFLNSFRDIIQATKPSTEAIKPASKTCSNAFARIGKLAKIVVLRNKSDFLCYEKLIYDNKVIPENTSIRIPPRYAKIVLLDLELPGSPFKLVYSSGEVLLKKKIGDTTLLIIYGDPGETSETLVSTKDNIVRVEMHGDYTFHVESNNRGIHVKVVHGGPDSILALESASGKRLLLVYTTKYRAERTWVLKDSVIISNIYFIGEYQVSSNSLRVEVELDKDSCGEVTIITPLELKKVKIGGVDLGLERIVDNVYRAYIPASTCKENPSSVYHADRAVLVEDPLWYKGFKIKPATPLEKNGFYENGLYVYTIKFKLDKTIVEKLPNKVLALAGFNDYAVLALNGVYLSSGYHYIEKDATEVLREGENKLRVILESTGHPNDGLLYVPNGIYTGVYLGKEEDIVLTEWIRVELKPPVSPEFDITEFIANPVQVKEEISRENYFDASRVRFIDSPGLYIGKFKVCDVNKHYVLDPGIEFYYNHYYRVLLFVNDIYVGPVIGPVEITKYLKPGANKMVLFVEWGVIAPIIRVFKHRVNGEWRVQEGTFGLISKWYKKTFSEEDTRSFPIQFRDMAGRVIWLKTRINYDKEPSSTRPVKLVVDSWGARLLVFINGNLIGRLCDDSASKELYVPEPALNKGINDITILAVLTSSNAGVGGVKLEEIYNHEKKVFYFY